MAAECMFRREQRAERWEHSRTRSDRHAGWVSGAAAVRGRKNSAEVAWAEKKIKIKMQKFSKTILNTDETKTRDHLDKNEYENIKKQKGICFLIKLGLQC